ncbi:type IV secretion system protein [Aurantiacibacter spongiae]|uniref:Type VI secretion protein n=1 Tax=Aurantiacibacter spongiae TaxID=2488860 RepID=A0A3N5CUE4_9SPHN|nr:type IV secretion system protein [Aurantiacibacter spongiae]RPF71050.1 type VI secretion protein [Aurantiacibacter spongiae]
MTNAAATCQRAMEGVGSGIGSSLRGVDCAASEMAQAAFNRLFSADGTFGPALTILLTLWIAFLGFGLITGRTRLGLSTLTPRMVTLVLVLTFATSWVAFQSVFWNLAVGAPDEIATVLMGTDGSATTIFADKLDVVMLSLMQASGDGAMDANTSFFSPPGLLWSGGTMLLLGTVGVLATCKIALAILMGLGPIFIVLALFTATRGLFTGWLKGVVMMALAPLFAVLGGSLMLELAVPVLSGISTVGGKIDVRAAMAFFMIGAVHLALMFMVLKVAATMVKGWSVFGLAANDRADERGGPDFAASQTSAFARGASDPRGLPLPASERAAGAASIARRDIRVPAATPVAANDSGPGHSTSRETRLVSAGSSRNGDSDAKAAVSRVRGVGSRFKSAPVRSTEKF